MPENQPPAWWSSDRDFYQSSGANLPVHNVIIPHLNEEAEEEAQIRGRLRESFKTTCKGFALIKISLRKSVNSFCRFIQVLTNYFGDENRRTPPGGAEGLGKQSLRENRSP